MKTQQFTLRPDERVGDGVVRVTEALVRRATGLIAQPTRDRAEDVHQVRVVIKRLRAILRLVRPLLGEERYRRENARLRRTARRLSTARDTMVAARTLERLLKGARAPRDEEALARILMAFADAELGKSRSVENCEIPLRKATVELRRTSRALARLEWSDLGREDLAASLQRSYRRALKFMVRTCAEMRGENLHEWRKRSKYLLYQLQIFQPLWPKRLGKIIANLNRLQNRIGSDHDLVVLRTLLKKSPQKYGGSALVARVVTCADRRSRRLRTQIESLGMRIFSEKPSRFLSKLEDHLADAIHPAVLDLDPRHREAA